MIEYSCPNCKTMLQWFSENPHRPFCSERCKNRDFVAWANETNRLPGVSEYDDLSSDELLRGKPALKD